MTDNDKAIPLWALDKAAQTQGHSDWSAFIANNDDEIAQGIIKLIARSLVEHMEKFFMPEGPLRRKARELLDNAFAGTDASRYGKLFRDRQYDHNVAIPAIIAALKLPAMEGDE